MAFCALIITAWMPHIPRLAQRVGHHQTARSAHRELGVSWRLGSGVARVDAEGVTLENGERIDAATVVWTAGARASALNAQIPG
nr:FAD-dependent oxidoreductase [Stenotrophomonas maltophilia]